MVKSSKQFLISSEAKNKYGFSVRTSGVDLSQFKRNPIMLWMHKRAFGTKEDVLPLGHWEDVKTSNGNIYGTPVFDDKDGFALTIFNKVESGIIRMASAGLIPLVWEDNGRLLSKSILEEVSLVDIGANNDALAVALYSENKSIINLSTLNLGNAYIQALASKSWEELERSNKLVELKVNDYDSYALKFNEQFGVYPKDYKPKHSGHSPYALKLFAKPYEELFNSDGLGELKKNAPDLYREKFFQEYGKYPTN
ncbi:hypothetical protein [Sphingobacterium cavernae]|uniref:hypothetical protein n=1 Tax=Sphingobacterium cavernae TaxID=2592657 RepID=UPI00122FCA17|nr:hypothetical protein [Sphingobacterium cavernae]